MAKKRPTKVVSQVAVFDWNEKTCEAAKLLAQGFTNQEVAERVGISERTLYRWQTDVEFSTEIDRLTLMIGVSARAERLRIAQRVARQSMQSGMVATDKDLLDWLKFAQSETDGIKLDLAALAAAFSEDEASLAGERPAGDSGSKASGKTYIN